MCGVLESTYLTLDRGRVVRKTSRKEEVTLSCILEDEQELEYIYNVLGIMLGIQATKINQRK